MTKTVKFDEGLPNLHQEKLEELKKLLPSLFDKDGNLIKSELENFTSGYAQEKSEPFVFSWAGKQKAKGLAFKQSETRLSLKFDENRSKNFDKTENLIIEGDNLHVLKLLLPSYKGKVKCIYIDPPYNTQNQFIYPDNFSESEKEYLFNSGQLDIDGDLIVNDRLETNGRKHSVWLSMMYPRLVLARELLRDDGVIFVSIDDNEVHHLRQLMNEVFGDDSVDSIIWQKMDARYDKNTNAKVINRFKEVHEYLLIGYKNSKKDHSLNKIKKLPDWNKEAKNPDKDPRGGYEAGIISYEEGHENEDQNSELYYSIILPSGRVMKRHFFVKKEEFEKLRTNNKIYFPKDGDGVPRLKIFQNEEQEYKLDSILRGFGTTQTAKNEIESIFEIREIFDTPKPIKMLKELIRASTQPNDLILDFFAGSGTTGQAVMELNQEEIDKKSKDGLLANEEKEVAGRKFILVQLPEKIDEKKEAYKVGYRKISDITIERVKRAGEKYKSVDNGFKVMTVTESAINRKLMIQSPQARKSFLLK